MILDANIDLAGVDTSMPRLEKGKYAAIIEDVSVEPSKKNPANQNLLVKFKTTEDGVSTRGEKINAGYPLRRYLPLQQSDNPNAQDFRKALAQLVDAAFGTSQADRPALNSETLQSLKGKELELTVSIQEDEQYGESNDVKSFGKLAR